MKLVAKIIVGIGFVLAATVNPPALSQEASSDTPRYSLDDAITLVKEEIGGRVLRAETLQRDNRTVYQVRIITDDGRVRTINVDAQNGIEE
jgi:uncharacterized membrane protein YkoI